MVLLLLHLMFINLGDINRRLLHSRKMKRTLKRAPTSRSLPTIGNSRKVILTLIFLIFLLLETHLKCRHIVGITYRRLRTYGFAQCTTPCSHGTRALHRDPATNDYTIPQHRPPLVLTLHILL